jgi:hypothetical protein
MGNRHQLRVGLSRFVAFMSPILLSQVHSCQMAGM